MKRIRPLLRRVQTEAAIIAYLAVTGCIGVATESAEPLSTRGIIDRLKPPAANGVRRLRGITIVPPDAVAKPPSGDVTKPLPDIARPLVPPSI